MAIADVLWSCPFCGGFGTLRPGRRGVEACERCGASFRRGAGAQIVATDAMGKTIERPAAEWMALLAGARGEPGEGGKIAEAQAEVRLVAGYDPVRSAGEFLNRIERLQPVRLGTLTLYEDRLEFCAGAGGSAETLVWPLLDVAALGSSSGTLQLRGKRSPSASIRLRGASIRWWEERLRGQLRELFRAAGRGEILEFQPRVVAR